MAKADLSSQMFAERPWSDVEDDGSSSQNATLKTQVPSLAVADRVEIVSGVIPLGFGKRRIIQWLWLLGK